MATSSSSSSTYADQLQILLDKNKEKDGKEPRKKKLKLGSGKVLKQTLTCTTGWKKYCQVQKKYLVMPLQHNKVNISKSATRQEVIDIVLTQYFDHASDIDFFVGRHEINQVLPLLVHGEEFNFGAYKRTVSSPLRLYLYSKDKKNTLQGLRMVAQRHNSDETHTGQETRAVAETLRPPTPGKEVINVIML